MNRAFAVAACLVLVGCAGPAGKDGARGPAGEQGPAGKDGAPGSAGKDAAVSGSRLKAQYQVGDDGSSAFYGWIDTKTQQPCTYYAAADGQPRCLPAKHGGTRFYADPACTTAVYVYFNLPSPPAYVPAQTIFVGKSTYLHLGQPENPVTTYDDNGSGCATLGAGNPSNTYVSVIEELSPDWFVAGTLSE